MAGSEDQRKGALLRRLVTLSCRIRDYHDAITLPGLLDDPFKGIASRSTRIHGVTEGRISTSGPRHGCAHGGMPETGLRFIKSRTTPRDPSTGHDIP